MRVEQAAYICLSIEGGRLLSWRQLLSTRHVSLIAKTTLLDAISFSTSRATNLKEPSGH
jgi:hypothetical protein